MERLDLVRRRCPDCLGSGRDRKKKKRPCPVCGGDGQVSYCPGCGKMWGRGSLDASGSYRVDEDDACGCYDGMLT